MEKYLTPEEWKKLEEDQQKENERKLKEKMDNWRERGLDKMMGGILEIKKEDELKKVVISYYNEKNFLTIVIIKRQSKILICIICDNTLCLFIH